MVTIRSAAATMSRCRRRSVEANASSARWISSSRSTMRASSEGIIPSRAWLAIPPERTRTAPLVPRAASIFSRRTWAITLRQVLA